MPVVALAQAVQVPAVAARAAAVLVVEAQAAAVAPAAVVGAVPAAVAGAVPAVVVGAVPAAVAVQAGERFCFDASSRGKRHGPAA